jgi:restriction endonuclease
MLDFSIIKSGEDFEFLCRDLLRLLGAQVEIHPSRGPDGGVDIVASVPNNNKFGFDYRVRVAVECKHFAGSNRSVKESDIGSFVERALSHNCDHYLLITSTLASASLYNQIVGVTNNPSIPVRATVWTKSELTKYVEQFPELRTRYLHAPVVAVHAKGPSPHADILPNQVLAIHLHPDFSDELQELLEKWNTVQDRIRFMAFRPPREREISLLSQRVFHAEDAYKIALAIRKEGGFERDDGIISVLRGPSS